MSCRFQGLLHGLRVAVDDEEVGAGFINGLIPFAWPPAARWPLLVIPVIAISLLFAEFTEKRREAWRRKIEAGADFIQASLRNRKIPLTSQDL